MFEAVKNIKKLTPKQPLLLKSENGLTANEQQQAQIVANFFKEQFFKNSQPMPNIIPTAMKSPFTAKEIKKASSKLKNNKSPGVDNITAEFIKYGPDQLFQQISNIFNRVAETGDDPQELTQGILRALQKPGKEKGPPQNLRPIILLSILRKILAICIMDRIGDRINQVIPLSQAAYR